MTDTVALSDLAAMPDPERVEELTRFSEHVQDPAAGGGLRTLNARIKGFERKFGFSSDVMLQRLQEGTLEETAGVAEWLIYLDTRSRCVAG